MANAAFQQPVATALPHYLTVNKTTLLPELKVRWQAQGFRTSGTREDVFGKSLATDEVFTAWYFGVFAEEIAKAGKRAYNLPMYVNAALNRPGRKPGDYPSAGPLPHVMDVWKAAAPSIDFLSPDFYNPDFKHWNDLYTRVSNPLFIPEHGFEPGVDAKAFYAFGHYQAIGFSPFSIESAAKPENEPLGKAYDVIRQMSNVMGNAAPGAMEGVLLNKEADRVRFQLGNYLLTVSHDYTLGWSPKAKETTGHFRGEFYRPFPAMNFMWRVQASSLHSSRKRRTGTRASWRQKKTVLATDNGRPAVA